MLITCIVPTYEKETRYLYESIGSLLAQDYNEIELIVSDDASTNFEADKIEKYIHDHKKSNIKKFLILHHENNLGTVRNLNTAISHSSGEIIVILSSDDKFHTNDVVSRIAEKFQLYGCDVLVCSRMKCSEDMKEQIRIMPHPSYINHINTCLNTAEAQFKEFALERSYEFASGAAMYYRRDYIKSFNGYDERFKLWEDGPFISRTTRTGTCIRTAYEIVSVDYRSGGISSKKSKKEKSRSQSMIADDYVNLIKYEYVPNLEVFSRYEQNIIKGNLARRENHDSYNIKIIAQHPASFVNYIFTKFQKAYFRLRYLNEHE